MSEEPFAADEEEQEDVWAGEQAEIEQVQQEKEDPFSLRATETRKVAEPVSRLLVAGWSSADPSSLAERTSSRTR